MAEALLRELTATGIEIIRDGGDLRVKGTHGTVAPFREAIRAHKPALLVLLRSPDDPLDLPDAEILRSEAARRSQREVDERVARLDARVNAAGATDRDRQLLRIWLAIAAEQDRPASPPTPEPIPASALPDPWNLEGSDVA